MWISTQLEDTGEDAHGSCHLPVPMALRPLYTRSAAPAHSPALHLPALGALNSPATASAARAQMKEKPSPVITRQRGPTNAQGLAERISHPGLFRAMPDLLLRRTETARASPRRHQIPARLLLCPSALHCRQARAPERRRRAGRPGRPEFARPLFRDFLPFFRLLGSAGLFCRWRRSRRTMHPRLSGERRP